MGCCVQVSAVARNDQHLRSILRRLRLTVDLGCDQWERIVSKERKLPAARQQSRRTYSRCSLVLLKGMISAQRAGSARLARENRELREDGGSRQRLYQETIDKGRK